MTMEEEIELLKTRVDQLELRLAVSSPCSSQDGVKAMCAAIATFKPVCEQLVRTLGDEWKARMWLPGWLADLVVGRSVELLPEILPRLLDSDETMPA